MCLGIFAKTFARATVEEVFDAVAEHGLECIQFNFSCAGLPSLPTEIPPLLATRIGESARTREIEIAAVSCTFNMIHPDKNECEKGFQALAAIAESCRALGTRLVTLCTGTRDGHDMWRAHPDNDSEAALDDLSIAMQRAIKLAEQYDVSLGVEPELGNVVNSARKARRLLDRMKSSRLRIIMDGANLLRAADLPRAREIWTEAFDLLGNDIAMVHAKDMTNDGKFVAAGKGALDYDFYLNSVRAARFAGPFILHGLAENEVEASLRFLRERQHV